MPSRESSQRIPQLDGLRGVAVLAVIVFHISFGFRANNLPLFASMVSGAIRLGWTGVDLFFVLSGFLITEILLDAKTATNYYKAFYTRRALRILPVYYAFLIFILLVPVILRKWIQMEGASGYPLSSQLWFVLNISNLRTAFSPMLIPSLSHFWTLAIEEQFYLVWPAVVRKVSERSLLIIAFGGITISALLRNLPIAQAINSSYDNFIYRWTPFRLDGLLLGAILAILLRKQVRRRTALALAYLAFMLGMIGTCLTAYGNGALGLGGVSRFGYTFVAVMYGGLLTLSLKSRQIGNIFRLRIFRELGRYSYCIYVVHVYFLSQILHLVRSLPFFDYSQNPSVQRRIYFHIVVSALTLTISYLVARVSWMFLEFPVLRLKKNVSYE